jgi:hypothetical protein
VTTTAGATTAGATTIRGAARQLNEMSDDMRALVGRFQF